MKNFYILTLIFLFLTPATAALSLTEQPMAKQRQNQFREQVNHIPNLLTKQTRLSALIIFPQARLAFYPLFYREIL